MPAYWKNDSEIIQTERDRERERIVLMAKFIFFFYKKQCYRHDKTIILSGQLNNIWQRRHLGKKPAKSALTRLLSPCG